MLAWNASGTGIAMHIDIFSDVICPWCYIGKRRLERALARHTDLAVTWRWRAFMLNPDMPPEGIDRQTYLALKFGGQAQAKRIYQTVLAAAASEGLALELDRIARTPNTTDAHRLIRWAGGQGRADPVVDRLFVAYFEDGADIGDPAALAAIAEAAGLDRTQAAAMLASEEGIGEIAAEAEGARKAGIHGVPCFIFDGQYAVSGAQDPEVFEPLFAAARAARGTLQTTTA